MPSDQLSHLRPLMHREEHIFCMFTHLYLMESYLSHSEEIFKTQKRINRIIMNSSKNASCQQLLKELNILPIQSQYIFSIPLFVIKNKDQYLFNSQVHKINTSQTSNLYLPSTNLAMFQKGVYYSGIKINNHLPTVRFMW